MKTLEVKDLDLHGSDIHQNSFNVKRFYEKLFNSECCSVSLSDSFDLPLFEYCVKNFTFIYHSGFIMPASSLKKELNVKNILSNIEKKKQPNFYFFHEEYIITLVLNDRNNKEDDRDDDDNDVEFIMPDIASKHLEESLEDKKQNSKKIDTNNTKININIYYPNYKFLTKEFKDKFKFLEKFKIQEQKKHCISVLMKNRYDDYDFEPLDIKVPEIDLGLNYGEGFKTVYDDIVRKLKKNNKGLYMFHGDPGTGKSSFIKYLTSVIDKEFIFIPTSFIEKFISDPDIFSILIKKKKCVIILEDAEKILISRERQDNEYISTILNLSDGILADMIQASVIITHNCDDAKIDKALKRKGRTMVDYRFNKLSMNDAKKLARSLKLSEAQVDSIKESMSLSEIYNIDDENKYYKDEENENRVIGFGKK
jgi:hypothetical protein